jgi:hypothetical protein
MLQHEDLAKNGESAEEVSSTDAQKKSVDEQVVA